jgi:hypothetical protein
MVLWNQASPSMIYMTAKRSNSLDNAVFMIHEEVHRTGECVQSRCFYACNIPVICRAEPPFRANSDVLKYFLLFLLDGRASTQKLR